MREGWLAQKHRVLLLVSHWKRHSGLLLLTDYYEYSCYGSPKSLTSVK